MEDNILLQEWSTPHGTPPFNLIRPEDFAPAIRKAIDTARTNINDITSQTDSPTFVNTIERLETASEDLDRATAILFNLNECHTNPVLQQTVLELTPEITRFENEIWMDVRLFERIKVLYKNKDDNDYSTEQRQVIENYYQRFVRNGVNLPDDLKQQYASNAEELATLNELFNQKTLDDTNDYVLHLTEQSQLNGLPENAIAAAHEEAEKRGLDGWVFTLKAPSYRPFMSFADDRDLREKMWRAYNSRGNRGNNNDNNQTIRKIANLRQKQANLLGYSDYASYKLARTMASDESTVLKFLDNLLKASLPYAKKDLAEVSDYAHSCGADYQLQNWDFSYWSEKLKRSRYDFDSEALRPYFQLEDVRQGIFSLYGKLYGLTFVENNDIPVYQEDVKVYEVFDSARFMGILYLDMFPRESKRSGAWMTEFRCQSHIGDKEVRPLIQVVCNFTKPAAGQPSLLTFDEVETFMHEMGHAMHGMLSEVHYPSISGTSVRRDFVEMPSQVMENWCYESEFLNTFARHYKTGETIPSEFIEKLNLSKNYLAGWLCLRQLNFGITDMAYHTLTSPMGDDMRVEDFEHSKMTELLPVVEGTCVSTSFTHIFSGGYAAGYYGYKWAEVLDADIFSRFKEEGIFNRETAKRFRREILSRGGSEHPTILFRNFMGRDPDNEALLRRCGFKKQ